MQKHISNTVRILILLLGAVVTANAIILPFVVNFNLGVALSFLFGGGLLFYGIFYHRIQKVLAKWGKVMLLLTVLVGICFAVFLHIYGLNDNVTYQEDVVIVLGAAIHNGMPSANLAERLNAAVEYNKKNPDALILVSGGQGHQETITEAQAMKTYLIEKGVPEDLIVKEEASTSTYENFRNSKVILEERFRDSYRVAYITNEYHIYRAGQIAKATGLRGVTHANGATPWYLLLPGTLRECLAVVKFWITKR